MKGTPFQDERPGSRDCVRLVDRQAYAARRIQFVQIDKMRIAHNLITSRHPRTATAYAISSKCLYSNLLLPYNALVVGSFR